MLPIAIIRLRIIVITKSIIKRKNCLEMDSETAERADSPWANLGIDCPVCDAYNEAEKRYSFTTQ